MSIDVALPPPPTVLEPTGGGGGGWVELVTARNDIDAHLLIGRLKEAGIQTRAVKDRRAAGAWLYAGSNPWAPVAVWVLRWQLAAARLVLAEISLEAAEPPPTDPEARGGAARSRLAWAWWAVALGLGVLLTLISFVQATALAAAGGSRSGCAGCHGIAR